MSFKEYRPGRGGGIFRSRSFGGFMNQRGSGGGGGVMSPTSPLATPVLGQGPRSVFVGGGNSRKLSPGLGSSSSFHRKGTPKVPKLPRPNRTLLMFHSVKKGIAECIKATEDDQEGLQVSEDVSAGSSTGQGRIMELEKQIKAAERHQKKLQFHLSKLEELEDDYKLQLQLREGVRNMAKAYVSSDGVSKKESLTQVKSGYKECTQNLCAIEAQLENMMGTFHCSLKGLEGFARLIPGDVFEVSIRHGSHQKWRTKGRVGAGTQTWDRDTHVFKALVADVLHIKAMENKSLKSVVLGQKNCETRDLFSSHPHMMTVNINPTGSIKLSILVQWNPLEGIDETFHPYEPAPRPQASTPRRPRPLVHSVYINESDSFSDISSDNSSSTSASNTPSSQHHRFSMPTFPSASSLVALTSYQPTSSSSSSASPLLYRSAGVGVGGGVGGASSSPRAQLGGATRPNSIAIMGTISELDAVVPSSSSGVSSAYHHRQNRGCGNGCGGSSSVQDLPSSTLATTTAFNNNLATAAAKQRHFDEPRPLRTSLSLQEDIMARCSHNVLIASPQAPATLEEALDALKVTLEDYQGQFPELQRLEEAVLALESLIKGDGGGETPNKEITQSIENALGAFDFLEAEYYHDGYGSASSSRRSSLEQLEWRCTLSPESTAKTADSGIECIATRLSEHTPSHDPPSTNLDAPSNATTPATEAATRKGRVSGVGVASMSVGAEEEEEEGGRGEEEEEMTTGNAQVDTVLISHLAYCDRLFENIGNFGPLKCREIRSVEKLRQQAAILESLTRLAKQGPSVPELQQVIQELGGSEELHKFWKGCVEGSGLYVNAEKFLAHLERYYGDLVREQYDISASMVFRHLVGRLLDLGGGVGGFAPELCRPCPNVTLPQLCSACSQHKDPRALVMATAHELWVVERLQHGGRDLAIKTVLQYRDRVPAPPCLRAMVLLLLPGSNTDTQLTTAVTTYIKSIGLAESRRKQSVVILVEALEDKSAELRTAALHALHLLKASEAQAQLVYLSHSDPSSMVRQKARDVLFSFGEEGRAAYEESQRTSHGFQGVRL